MAEQYSIQAETLMKSAVEDYEEVIKLVQASNANMALIKAVKITLNGKPRRLVDVGDLRTGESENKLQVLVFNKDHIESLLEAINEAGFETEVDDQFINIDVPDPSYKQLMEVVEDLQRKKKFSSW
jgi:ribosome recycling factor